MVNLSSLPGANLTPKITPLNDSGSEISVLSICKDKVFNVSSIVTTPAHLQFARLEFVVQLLFLSSLAF